MMSSTKDCTHDSLIGGKCVFCNDPTITKSRCEAIAKQTGLQCENFTKDSDYCFLHQHRTPSTKDPKNDWIKYTGDYEKRWYDIKLNSDYVIKDCWPNAGYWHCITDGRQFKSNIVKYIRPTDDPHLREANPTPNTKDPKQFVPADECKKCGKTLKRLFGEYEDCPTCTPQDPKCLDCGKTLPKDYPFTYCEADWEKRYPTPQATKPVDEQIEAILAEYRISILIADMITGPKTRIKGFKKCTDQTTQAIEALLTEARIDEVKRMNETTKRSQMLASSKFRIYGYTTDRLAQLKNERSNK